MSRAREAAIYREIARLLTELADDVAGSAANETDRPGDERPSRARPKVARKPRPLTRPAGEASPEIAELARRNLRARGFG